MSWKPEVEGIERRRELAAKHGGEDAVAVQHDLGRLTIRERIAGFKCPRTVSFSNTPLPLSGAGKILKTELRKPYWEGKEKQVN